MESVQDEVGQRLALEREAEARRRGPGEETTFSGRGCGRTAGPRPGQTAGKQPGLLEKGRGLTQPMRGTRSWGTGDLARWQACGGCVPN